MYVADIKVFIPPGRCSLWPHWLGGISAECGFVYFIRSLVRQMTIRHLLPLIGNARRSKVKTHVYLEDGEICSNILSLHWRLAYILQNKTTAYACFKIILFNSYNMNVSVSRHGDNIKKVEVDNYSLNVWRKLLYHFSRKVSLGRDILGVCSVHKRIILNGL
jgi:hypothetical protein